MKKKSILKYVLVVVKYAITLLIGVLGGETLASCSSVL